MNKVIVAGSINMDIVAFTPKHPKTGETVLGTDLKYFPGGKGANQAVASAKLGTQTVMIGKVGDDNSGPQLIEFLKAQGVENKIEIVPNVSTGTALITIATETSDNTIVIIPGANFKLTEKDIEKVMMEKGDVLISQLEIPIETVQAFFKKGHEIGTTNIFNPAPAHEIGQEILQYVDILILNETELEIISHIKVDTSNDESIGQAVQEIKNDNQTIIVTLGEKGVVGFIGNEIVKIAGRKVDAVDTTGAGDCFVGAVASQIVSGVSIVDAISFANVAASISVTRAGAGPSMPTKKEVEEIISLK